MCYFIIVLAGGLDLGVDLIISLRSMAIKSIALGYLISILLPELTSSYSQFYFWKIKQLT